MEQPIAKVQAVLAACGRLGIGLEHRLAILGQNVAAPILHGVDRARLHPEPPLGAGRPCHPAGDLIGLEHRDFLRIGRQRQPRFALDQRGLGRLAAADIDHRQHERRFAAAAVEPVHPFDHLDGGAVAAIFPQFLPARAIARRSPDRTRNVAARLEQRIFAATDRLVGSPAIHALAAGGPVHDDAFIIDQRDRHRVERAGERDSGCMLARDVQHRQAQRTGKRCRDDHRGEDACRQGPDPPGLDPVERYRNGRDRDEQHDEQHEAIDRTGIGHAEPLRDALAHHPPPVGFALHAFPNPRQHINSTRPNDGKCHAVRSICHQLAQIP